MKKDTYINEQPNFTIVMPGPCNAKCSFCFWDRNQTSTQYGYADKVRSVISALPAQFRKVSISGGEPTISKALPSVLSALRGLRHRLDRVVLTTNGTRISECVNELDGVVDFVNISRHAIEDDQNFSIFNTRSIPTAKELSVKIAQLNDIGIPVTLSKVLSDNETKRTIIDYIEFAKSVGASKVFLRRPNGTDLEPHPVEREFSRIRSIESGCPVCIDIHQIISGMACQWKRGLLEPSDIGYHELVMQPSGDVTFDWAGSVKFTKWPDVKNQTNNRRGPAESQQPFSCSSHSFTSFSGCGMIGRGC